MPRKKRNIPHGTSGGYTNHKCRCPKCRRAWREYIEARRKRIGCQMEGCERGYYWGSIGGTYYCNPHYREVKAALETMPVS